mmetsp:Transcript_5661/g.7884  ORF Transcript_5661/g.7884 Transcript_5661/m.7884 type:complete len:96 (-) Transcript_5661:766-1053(-)
MKALKISKRAQEIPCVLHSGVVRDVHRPSQQRNNQKQYLYVSFSHRSEMQACVRVRPHIIEGYTLNVAEAIPRPLSHQSGSWDFGPPSSSSDLYQ